MNERKVKVLETLDESVRKSDDQLAE